MYWKLVLVLLKEKKLLFSEITLRLTRGQRVKELFSVSLSVSVSVSVSATLLTRTVEKAETQRKQNRARRELEEKESGRAKKLSQRQCEHRRGRLYLQPSTETVSSPPGYVQPGNNSVLCRRRTFSKVPCLTLSKQTNCVTREAKTPIFDTVFDREFSLQEVLSGQRWTEQSCIGSTALHCGQEVQKFRSSELQETSRRQDFKTSRRVGALRT